MSLNNYSNMDSHRGLLNKIYIVNALGYQMFVEFPEAKKDAGVEIVYGRN